MCFIINAVRHRRDSKKKQRHIYDLSIAVSVSAILLVLSDIACSKAVSELVIYEIALAMFPMIIGMKSAVSLEKAVRYGTVLLVCAFIIALLRMAVSSGNGLLHTSLSFLLPSLIAIAYFIVLYCDFINMISDKGHMLNALSVRSRVNNDLNLLYIFGILSVFVLQLSVTGSPLCRSIVFVICLSSILALFCCCQMRVISGRLIAFSKKRDNELKDMMELCANDSSGNNTENNYRAIYERVLVYFETEKPYLDQGLTIDGVAKKIFCNRLYLSRAISLFSGRNFCQYVNYYRIKHAVKIFEDDNDMKMQEWAELSGFKTIASFTMAFRLYMNETPGEWSRRIKRAVPRVRCKKMSVDGQ